MLERSESGGELLLAMPNAMSANDPMVCPDFRTTLLSTILCEEVDDDETETV